ncbi:MAG: response regulator [Gammaproteobacteria bacterium]|nr:response regulator [Gammaproteobacteria bacterium]MDX5374476.1 response regulator [Gammaproteobacteria bacterium]
MTPARFLTTGEIGKYCGVHFRTVIRWIERGELKGHKLPGRGDHRVQVEDFVAFLHRNRMPIPAELAPIEPNRRVLVTDDDENMARAMARTLTRAGYETRIAGDGLQAGVLLESYRPGLMTLDLRMPGLSGFQVLDFIRTESRQDDLRILVVSALDENELQRAVSRGADDYLMKPFENAELVSRIQGLLPLSPTEA